MTWSAGDYLFTVTDANGCTLEVPVTITQPEEITASTVITNVSCFGLSDGAVVITPAGGTAPYTITPAQIDLAAGDYLFTVTDANGCTLEVPVTIAQTEPITAITAVTDADCFGSATGDVTLTVSGGTPEYTYLWSNGATTLNLTDVTAGTYSVTVTDANLCTATASAIVNDGPAPVIPTFIQLGPYCVGTIPDVLPLTSTNGIIGTWNPAAISTAVAGSAVYTFTPDAGQCATSFEMTVDVVDNVTPVFTQIDPILINSVPPGLPTTSNNGITGTWNPGTINTSVPGTFTYTFTPDDGQCATPITMDITITSPVLTITKSADPLTYTAVDQVITYTIVVENVGNVTLTDISVTDPLTGLIESIASLSPGESDSFTTTYTIIQNDLITGEVENIAYAQFTFAGENYEEEARVTVTVIPDPRITITKVADEESYSEVGDILHYTIVVTNTGNVPLTNVVVTDVLTSLDFTIPNLPVGEQRTFTGTYTVEQDDLDAGEVVNTATATFTYNNEEETVEAVETVDAVQDPALTIEKVATETSFSAVGDVIHYTITVTNTGNVTLTNITVVDPLTDLDQIIASLAPGDFETITTSYIIDLADLNAGEVENTATASSTFGGNDYNDSDTENVPAVTTPVWTLTKEADEVAYNEVGDVLHYTLTLENTGNISISAIAISDPGADAGSISFESGDANSNSILDPGETWTYGADHTIVQADMNAGHYSNTATASGTPASGTLQPVSATEDVPAVFEPAIRITKTSQETSYSTVGQTINYTIVVTNISNITLEDVVVSDDLTGMSMTIEYLESGEENAEIINTVYVITQEDIDLGFVANTATAAYSYAGDSFEQEAHWRVEGIPNPEITITKDAAETSFALVGDVINYTIVVTKHRKCNLDKCYGYRPAYRTGCNYWYACSG